MEKIGEIFQHCHTVPKNTKQVPSALAKTPPLAENIKLQIFGKMKKMRSHTVPKKAQRLQQIYKLLTI